MKLCMTQQLGWKVDCNPGVGLCRAKGKQGSGHSKSNCKTEDKKERNKVPQPSVTGDISLEFVTVEAVLSGCSSECQSDSTEGGEKREGSRQMDDDSSYRDQ